MKKIGENYEAVIGMEIHAELKTERKMFCGCPNDPDEKQENLNTCVVCLGHPGALPVPNRKAIEEIIKIGLALEGGISEVAVFSRKNYFYPDLPKGYQITSQPDPFVVGGFVDIGYKKIKIDHIHLEEDTGTLIHNEKETAVNFNRSGLPLMELVTTPDIRSGYEARRFCEELQLMLRYLGVAEANMEKGEMRCEVNISVRPKGQKQFGVKVEIKNLNSFRAVERSIEYEIARQIEILESGGKVEQETRGFDEIKGVTMSQRKKEEAHDYRYFAEPDLPVYKPADFKIEEIRATMPERPMEKRIRLKKEYKLSEEQAEVLVLDKNLANFFEAAASELKLEEIDVAYQTLYNYLVSDLRGFMKSKNVDFSELKVTPENFVDLVVMVQAGEIGSRAAKDVLLWMFETGGDPRVRVQEEGLKQVSDESILKVTVDEIINKNRKVVEQIRAGKESAIMFLVGQAMRELKGSGDPQILKSIFEKEILNRG